MYNVVNANNFFEDFYMDLDLNDNLCPPTLTSPSEIAELHHNGGNIDQNSGKVYASDLLQFDQPPSSSSLLLLTAEINEISQEQATTLLDIYLNTEKLLKLNDACDIKGIQYLTAITDTLCIDSVEFSKISESFQNYIKKIFISEDDLPKQVQKRTKCIINK